MDGILCDDSGNRGGIGFMLLAIFLIVLFVLFRRDNSPIAEGLGGLLPAATTLMTQASPADQIAINRQANFVDPEIAQIRRDQAVDTGVLSGLIDRQTCDILRSVDQSTARTVENANRNALEAERIFTQSRLDERDDRIAELRQQLSEKDNRILHQQTLNALYNSTCQLDNRLTRMEDRMLQKPPFYAAGGTPLIGPCVSPASFVPV